MASLEDVKEGLVSAIEAALSAASITGAQVGARLPSDDVIQDVAQGTSSVIAVYLKQSTFKPVMRLEQSQTDTDCGITSTASDFSLAPSQTVTITLAFAQGSSAVNGNDTIGVQLWNGDFEGDASATAAAGDTLDSLAAKLVSAINSAFTGLVNATSNGAVVSVEITGGNGYHVATATGNRSILNETVSWACRYFQIIVWTGDPDVDTSIHQCLEDLFNSLDDNFGIALADETIRVRYTGAIPDYADQQKDVYRDNHLLSVDHMCTIPYTQYPIVASNPTVEPDLLAGQL